MKALRSKFIKLSNIPKDIDSVTTIDSSNEVDPASVGMTQADIDAIWTQIVRLYKTGNHPGVSLSLRRQGKLVMSRGLGHANGNGPDDNEDTPKTLFTADTPICLFSTSKGVTALLIHMLAEDGLINLMDPVAKYAPEFGSNGKENITIHQILSHRGGMPKLPPSMSMEQLWETDQAWAAMCGAKAEVTDGSTLAYNPITGGYILERLVRIVTGQDLNVYIDKKIRRPMGMKYFSYGLPQPLQPDMAQTYLTGPRSRLINSVLLKQIIGCDTAALEMAVADPDIHETILPSANLIGSADEVGRFFQMMLDGGQWQGQKICEPSTIERAVQEFGNRSIDKALKIPMRYSAGMMLGDEPFGVWGPNSKHAFGHLGLANKLSWADPARDISVSLLNSGMPLISHHLPALINTVRTIGNCTA